MNKLVSIMEKEFKFSKVQSNEFSEEVIKTQKICNDFNNGNIETSSILNRNNCWSIDWIDSENYLIRLDWNLSNIFVVVINGKMKIDDADIIIPNANEYDNVGHSDKVTEIIKNQMYC